MLCYEGPTKGVGAQYDTQITVAPMDERRLSVKEIAEYLGVSKDTVYV